MMILTKADQVYVTCGKVCVYVDNLNKGGEHSA